MQALEDGPRICVVGRIQMDWAAVQGWLGDHHTRWENDLPFDGTRDLELIAEFGGRHCFDDQTEILTNEGWKHFADLRGDESVMTLSPQTGTVEFQVPRAYIEYPYDGNLLVADGRDVSFAVTPGHRQWGRFKNGAYGFVRTDQINGRQFAIKATGATWSGQWPEAIEIPGQPWSQAIVNQYGAHGTVATATKSITITGQEKIAALATLMTYYATEGSLIGGRTSGGQGIVIYGDHEEAVRGLCGTLALPVNTSIDPRNGVKHMYVGGGMTIRAYFESRCGSGSQNKRLPQWILNLPTEALQRVWDTLVTTDGFIHNEREILSTTSTTLAGQAQEILCKLGHYATMRRYSDGVNFPCYQVGKKQGRDILLNKNVKITERHYTGFVRCVTTDNGIVYVRRNGKPHFSGNCYDAFGDAQFRKDNDAYLDNIIGSAHGSVVEHAVVSLLVENVSRSLTHELIRHRVGVAYSQRSQRYVDEGETNYVVPPVMRANGEAYRIWQEAIEHAETAYRKLYATLAAGLADDTELTKRDRRIQAREAARSVLPQATETRILVTANLRVLRHICETRGGIGAEAEIRRFAVTLAYLMKKEAPNLFADIEVGTLADGKIGVAVAHHKI